MQTNKKPSTGRPDKVLKIQETVQVSLKGKGGRTVKRWVGHALAKTLVDNKKATLVK